jgi:hypothetical protein
MVIHFLADLSAVILARHYSGALADVPGFTLFFRGSYLLIYARPASHSLNGQKGINASLLITHL